MAGGLVIVFDRACGALCVGVCHVNCSFMSM